MLLIRSCLLVVAQLMMSPLAEMELGLPLLAVEISERGLGRQIGGDITIILHIIS